jgi:hypothetical protein
MKEAWDGEQEPSSGCSCSATRFTARRSKTRRGNVAKPDCQDVVKQATESHQSFTHTRWASASAYEHGLVAEARPKALRSRAGPSRAGPESVLPIRGFDLNQNREFTRKASVTARTPPASNLPKRPLQTLREA